MDMLKSFSLHELYFLTSAFDCQSLFALPELQKLHIVPDETWKSVRESLIEKKLLDEDGKLTKEGSIVISMLEEYSQTDSLTIMNNFLIAACENKDYSIVISLNKEDKYFVFKIDFVMMLQFLSEKIPSYTHRIPNEEEKTFLKKEVTLTSELKKIFTLDSALFVQHYPIAELKTDKNVGHDSWIFSIHDNSIFALDVHKETAYLFSQYYLFERLYTWLNIPFKKKEGSQEHENSNNSQWHF